ncbi:hypothetical protein V1512DRAFT_267941 [Lipomyces arxii]|uniref:uncharacterized protein n=1 Tax=Lipomyces arxii TaxID=56418 RepID=UPI0034CD6824
MTSRIRFVVEGPPEDYQKHTDGKQQANTVHRQKRVFRACKTCKIKKIRCSGGQPCAVCGNRSIKCEYAEKDGDNNSENGLKRQKRENSVSSSSSLGSSDMRSLPVPAVITWAPPATDPAHKQRAVSPTSVPTPTSVSEPAKSTSIAKVIDFDLFKTLKLQIECGTVLQEVDFKRTIFVTLDTTTVGWGAILSQNDEQGHRNACKYETGVWEAEEAMYATVKLECLGLMRALKALRYWLMGNRFVVETIATLLSWVFNKPIDLLSNTAYARWLSYIRLFDFEVHNLSVSADVYESQSIQYSDAMSPESTNQAESMSSSVSTASTSAFEIKDYSFTGFDVDFDFEQSDVSSQVSKSMKKIEKPLDEFEIYISDEHLWDEFEESSWDSTVYKF